MEIAFGLLVLALIILGLRNRKKEKKVWIKEERYEDSGDWIDKRSGERGTYGSLDEEMEAKRLHLAKQGKISALAQSIQTYLFEQHADFQGLTDDNIKTHLAFCKSEISALFEKIDQLIAGRVISMAAVTFLPSAFRSALKKLILDFSFERFPMLLDLEIEEIKKFDLLAEQLANKVLLEVERLKG
ncbi:MAG: hypothetical protein Q7T20_04085 [Saprospiraceae bacterium]|nr:hypothetical protein [Saprospiraceae bacterium]